MSTQVEADEQGAGAAGGGAGTREGMVRAGQRRASQRRSSQRVRQAVGAGVLLALLVAMVASTRFLTPEEAQELNPVAFDAAVYVDEELPGIAEDLTGEATDITELAPAILADPAAAADAYGVDVGSGSVSYAVTASGTVGEVDADFAIVDVQGVPDGTVVRIPLAGAISGTPIRDAAGLRFSDFNGQTDFQSVANELGLAVRDDVIAPADVPSLAGQPVTVTGAYTPGGPQGSYIIQPVTIEAGA